MGSVYCAPVGLPRVNQEDALVGAGDARVYSQTVYNTKRTRAHTHRELI